MNPSKWEIYEDDDNDTEKNAISHGVFLWKPSPKSKRRQNVVCHIISLVFRLNIFLVTRKQRSKVFTCYCILLWVCRLGITQFFMNDFLHPNFSLLFVLLCLSTITSQQKCDALVSSAREHIGTSLYSMDYFGF